MDRRRTAVNVLVVAALAAAVYLLPNGGRGANTFGALLSVTFPAVLVLIAGRAYQERRMSLYGLGDRYRALLYGAAAVGVVDITAQPRLFQTAAGEIAWFVILGAVIYALVVVYRYSRTY